MQRKMQGGTDSARKRAIIFDFDGTIADSFEYVLTFLLREARNTTVYSDVERQKLRMMSMHRLALHVGVAPWKLVVVFVRGRRYMRHNMGNVRSFAGMDSVIKQLHTDGWDLFIASANSNRNIRLLLEHENLSTYFRGVQAGSGFMGKPRIIRYILKRYKLDPEQVWYIGDETGDVVSAAAAGVRSLAVAWGFADPEKLTLVQPTAFAEKPADIIKILE